jgi:integrase
MEAKAKTDYAMGGAGLLTRKKIPTLKEFLEGDFSRFIKQQTVDKPSTGRYYADGKKALLAFPALANARLDAIKQEQITAFVGHLREQQFEVSSMNRKLEVLRRALRLAVEWEKVERALPTVRMLPGEKRRERVLSPEEETRYLEAAVAIGDEAVASHQRALGGIRATLRGQIPITPRDPYLLRDAAVLLIECGLRPEECHRLRWDEVADGVIRVAHGKTANARREIPLSERAAGVLEMRRTVAGDSEWVFPASTRSGHIESSSLKKQHTAACEKGKVEFFPPYTFRHTCLTRWAAHMDPYTLSYLAGHSDFSTTRRYVHPQKAQVLEAMRKAQEAKGAHKMGHSASNAESQSPSVSPAIH